MNNEEQITNYINSQSGQKSIEMAELHSYILSLLPGTRLWYDDGRNAENKVVSNPNIGYGLQKLKYANGSSKEFFQIGLSANTTGFSIYILGLKDKSYLASTYGKRLGKATVTGYCIKFKTIRDIQLDVLGEAILYGVKATQ
jgi:hypothetical protein